MNTAPTLSSLQLAWLQEIGLDKHMLARYATEAEPFPDGAATGEHAAGRVRAVVGAAATGSPPQGAGAAPSMAKPALAPPISKPAATMLRAGDALAGNLPQAVKEPRIEAPAGPLPDDWEALREHVAQCQACGLHTGRSQTVFGSGQPQSPEWLIVGEAPGDFDDRAGLPFQGKPGVLLGAMLASIGLQPDTPVFFTNVIKCRPLGNRTPRPDEIAACKPYLRRQIALLAPRRILALGRLAAQALLDDEGDLDALRGRVHQLRCETGRDIPLVATHHPASLLMRPQHKADAWRDLNLARSVAVETDGAGAAR
ncbi:MAG: uracil-DNA glycosylase [Burkholderiaceae bacterium]